APLAGIAGPGTALPMAVSIAVLALLAAAVTATATRPRDGRVTELTPRTAEE
ncbi:Bcr/CflA family drug resistance efflux transporter, partial [Actinomadura bangladeshensis]|nr:Bcr/CflA family drug resistance efflux transporter [Actinomadura bangladeshensis]